jgi:hypothetical protein
MKVATSTRAGAAGLKRLLLKKLGQRACAHFFRIVAFRGRLFLRCDYCQAETEGFEIYRPLRGGR